MLVGLVITYIYEMTPQNHQNSKKKIMAGAAPTWRVICIKDMTSSERMTNQKATPRKLRDPAAIATKN